MSRTLLAIGLLAGAALLPACGPRTTPLSDEFKESLADWSAGKAVDDALRRQIAPGGEAAASPVLQPGDPIWIQAGKSRVVRFPTPVRRVSISNPDMAGIVVLGPTTLLINAKVPEEAAPPATMYGSRRSTVGVVSPTTITPPPRVQETSLVVWGASGAPSSHTIFVADFIDRQVMLEVTVAEVNRSSLEQHGIDFRSVGSSFSSNMFMGGGFGPLVGQDAIVPTGDAISPLAYGLDRPNFAFRLPQDDITALIQVLQSEGLATILAQPKILALSGQNALFQAGGEIAIPIVNAFVAEVEFKPFGTLVNFLPRVSEEGDILLTVTPEVSQVDASLVFPGISNTPGFRTRRMSTTARLRDGETLVLGGLLQTRRQEVVRGIPYLQDLPVVGAIFRETEYDEEVTELMVVVTPRLVSPIAAGETIALPTDRPRLTNEEVRTKPDPAEATRPRLPGLGTGATLPGLP